MAATEAEGAQTRAAGAVGVVTPDNVLALMASLAAGLAGLGILYGYIVPRKGATLPRAAWLPKHAGKRWTELYFLGYAVVWIAFMGGIVASGAYEEFDEWSYMKVGCVLALPYMIGPLVLPGGAGEPKKRLWKRYFVKANVWIAIISYVGNYFWTHYFYKLLGASYTFPAHRLNDVPIAMFLCTHGYFAFYHSGTTILLRRFWTSRAYNLMPVGVRQVASASLILLMAWFTAVSECFTISAFPYYSYPSAEYMYTVGAVCYGIYFIVSFPMYYRLEEDGNGWSISKTAIDSLGACMLVTILLDLWRLVVGGVSSDPQGSGLPWMS